MAAGPVPLDRTPAPPPQVGAQMQSPASGLAAIIQAIRAKQMAEGGGQPPPPGAPGAAPVASPATGDNAGFTAQADLVENVLNQMARVKPTFAPWGNRMLSLLRAGVAESIQAPASGQEPPPASEPAGGSATAPGNSKVPASELARGFSG